MVSLLNLGFKSLLLFLYKVGGSFPLQGWRRPATVTIAEPVPVLQFLPEVSALFHSSGLTVSGPPLTHPDGAIGECVGRSSLFFQMYFEISSRSVNQRPACDFIEFIVPA